MPSERMEVEAREDYYRCQKDLELYATEKGENGNISGRAFRISPFFMHTPL